MEFLIPVKFTGIRYQRVTAETLDDAVKQASHQSDIQARFELSLANTQFDILAPRLMLTKEQMETWPYWEYQYSGVDGTDWRVGYTNNGKGDIPSFAESFAPVPADWIASWREEQE